MADETIFYDLPAKDGKPWSFNPWKARLVLNYKGIPYKTQWVEYPDIAPLMKSFSVPPGEGDTPYTIPVIKFQGKHTMNSKDIAQLLEAAHPEPSIRVDDPMLARVQQCVAKCHGPLVPIWMPQVPYNLLNESSKEYFIRTRSEKMGRPLEEMMAEASAGGPEVEARWEEARAPIEEAAQLIKENPDGPYLTGKEPIYADFLMASLLHFYKRINEDIFQRFVKVDPVFVKYLAGFEKWMDKDD